MPYVFVKGNLENKQIEETSKLAEKREKNSTFKGRDIYVPSSLCIGPFYPAHNCFKTKPWILRKGSLETRGKKIQFSEQLQIIFL